MKEGEEQAYSYCPGSQPAYMKAEAWPNFRDPEGWKCKQLSL